MKIAHYSVIWLAMLLLTLSSYSIAKAGYEGQLFVAFVLCSAFIKGQFIIDFFMKLKWAGLMWRIIVSLWLLIVLSVIAGLYLANG